MAVKRLRYYDQQFLVEADFTDEQKYHLEMRRRATRLLHTFGIAEGLEVQRTGNRQVTVKPGVAIDRDGREIVVETDQVVSLDTPAFLAATAIFLTIAYQEAPSDPATATGTPGDTRITETPLIQATTTAPVTDGTVIRLAQINKGAGADLPGNPGDVFDGGVRQTTSARLGTGAIAAANLANGAVTDTKIAAGAVTAAKLAAGAVSDVNIAAATISEAKLAAALAAKINTPAGIVSLDGVSRDAGGNVDLVGANAILVTPNNTTKQITISESHSAVTGNPHATQASQLLGYDLRLRQFASLTFTHANANGATQTVTTATVPPRIVIAISSCSVFFGTRPFGAGSFGFCDFATSPAQQRCFGPGFTHTGVADWFMRSAGVQTAGICSAHFVDNSIAPARTEDLLVTVVGSATGLTATLSRTSVNPFPAAAPQGFSLVIQFFVMSA